MGTTRSQSRISMKEKLFAHVEMMRPYTVIWCGLVSLAGACLTFGDIPSLRVSLLTFFIPIFGWIAGLYLSDYLDRALDAIQKPHRPIPSGRISPNEALVVGALFASSGFALSFLLTVNNILLVFVVAALVFFYAKLSKSRGLLGNLNRGIVAVISYLFGIFAVDKPFAAIPLSIWFLSLLFLIHDTNSNLVGAIRDMEGDKKGGYQTFPVKYGIKRSVILSLVLSILYLTLLFFVTLLHDLLSYPLRFYSLFLLAICFLLLMYVILVRSLDALDRKKALLAHEFFVVERITLASALIVGMVASYLISYALFLACISVTLMTQFLIRKRYEFTSIP